MRIAKRYDGIVKPSGGVLVAIKLGEAKTASGEDMPTVTVAAEDCTDYSYITSSRDGNGSNSSDKTGSGTVVAFWHATKAAKRKEIRVGSGEPVKQLRHYYPTEAAARAAAQAEIDKRERGAETFSVTMPGNTKMSAECKLVATGFHPDVDGTWLTKTVTHRLSARGYKCDVECEVMNDDE